MRLPRQLLINDDIWTVKFIRKIKCSDYPKHIELVGLCDPVNFVISIQAGLNRRERFKTYVHEVLHAIEFSYDFKIPHKLIYRIEEPAVAFLIENFIGAI